MDDGGGRRDDAGEGRRRRADAELNYSRIIEAAVLALRDDPRATIDEVAARSGVARVTIYRHFGSRQKLMAAAERHAREEADANERDALRSAGELSGGPTPLSVVDILNKVPPHLVGDQIVAEARRLDGVSSAALYLVDIDGSRLLLLAGSPEFPAQLPAPLAVGPELPRGGVPGLRRQVEEILPGVALSPLYLRGRAIGVLVALGAAEEPLAELARQAAAAVELAKPYTDVLDIVRRRKDISAASEIQQNLLPPRIGRLSGATVAGNVLPCYDVGGDWFDYVDNADGGWLGLADAIGMGPSAAALASIALGAFRAARRNGADLIEAVGYMDECVTKVGGADAPVSAVIGRWHGPASTFTWINRGHPAPLVIRRRRASRAPRARRDPAARHGRGARARAGAPPADPGRAPHPLLGRRQRARDEVGAAVRARGHRRRGGLRVGDLGRPERSRRSRRRSSPHRTSRSPTTRPSSSWRRSRPTRRGAVSERLPNGSGQAAPFQRCANASGARSGAPSEFRAHGGRR